MLCSKEILKLQSFPTFAKRNIFRNVRLSTQTHQSFACKRNELFIPKRNFSCIKVPEEEIRNLLSSQNKKKFIERLEATEKRDNDKRLQSCTEEASVLVPVCIVDNKPSLLFTLRSETLVSHRGQVRFVKY